MCFSPEVSFAAAAVLVPSGAAAMSFAERRDRRYLPLATLPLLFGVQQLLEGLVWTSGAAGDLDQVRIYSTAYLFFAWLAWPVWVPLSVYWLEPARRKPYFLIPIIAGAVLGSGQFLPYLAHGGWVQTTFLPRAVVYGGTELFQLIIGRIPTYTIYLSLVIAPALLSSDRRVKVFGLLIALAFAVTNLFFRYAYISVFCFWGAVMSLYLVWMMARLPGGRREAGRPAAAT